jgi:hypothetical protein
MSKKRAKNQNALKHGAYSRQVILPGEKKGDYEAFRKAHYDEWTPDGVTEEYVVDDLCRLRWQKQRMEQYNQICLQQQKDEMLLANKASEFMEKLRELAHEFLGATSVAAVEEILSRLSVSQNNFIVDLIPPNGDPTQWGQSRGRLRGQDGPASYSAGAFDAG